MNGEIAALLVQDGLVNGAIYALLALALVLVFAVTRVIFLPQGEFVAFGALTLAMLQNGVFPGTVWLLLGIGFILAVRDGVGLVRYRKWSALWRLLVADLVLPLLLVLFLYLVVPLKPGFWINVPLTLLIVVPLGPKIYRFAYEPIAEAPVLLLLMVSVAVHWALLGLGLLLFGPEGYRLGAFVDGNIQFGLMNLPWQQMLILIFTCLIMALLYYMSGHTLYGKSLRATAINRTGARLVGISVVESGRVSFQLASFIGVLSGILYGTFTIVYYNSGFSICLKGFVGAIIGGLVSFPLAVIGAISVGFLESFSSFWWSAHKEEIVFTLIIPILLWRSLRTHHPEEES